MTYITNESRAFYAKVSMTSETETSTADWSIDFLGNDPCNRYCEDIGGYIVPAENLQDFLIDANSSLYCSFKDEKNEREFMIGRLTEKGISREDAEVMIPQPVLWTICGAEIEEWEALS